MMSTEDTTAASNTSDPADLPPFTPEQQEWIRQLVSQRPGPAVASSIPTAVPPSVLPTPASSLPPPGNVG